MRIKKIIVAIVGKNMSACIIESAKIDPSIIKSMKLNGVWMLKSFLLDRASIIPIKYTIEPRMII